MLEIKQVAWYELASHGLSCCAGVAVTHIPSLRKDLPVLLSPGGFSMDGKEEKQTYQSLRLETGVSVGA